jgi:hypothetical protein
MLFVPRQTLHLQADLKGGYIIDCRSRYRFKMKYSCQNREGPMTSLAHPVHKSGHFQQSPVAFNLGLKRSLDLLKTWGLPVSLDITTGSSRHVSLQQPLYFSAQSEH